MKPFWIHIYNLNLEDYESVVKIDAKDLGAAELVAMAMFGSIDAQPDYQVEVYEFNNTEG